MPSLSLLPPTGVNSSVIKSQDNGKHKTAANVRLQQQHSPTTSASQAVTQNCGTSNSVSSPSELLSKKGSPMSGPNLPQVSLQRMFSPGLLSPNSSQSQHCNKPLTGHISPASRATGMLSGHPSQNQRAFLSPGQNLQNQKNLLTGQTGHGAEVAHRLSASSNLQQERDGKLGSGSSLAGTADGKLQKADVAQRLFEQKVKPKATAIDMKNKFRLDQHFLDLQTEILIDSHKKLPDSRASEHAAEALTAGTASSSKRTSSSGMHSQWPTTKTSVSSAVISPSSANKAAGRIVKSDSMQTSSAALSSVAAHIQNTESAVPKPAHMGAHKHAGQTKTNPPPAHGGIGSQGQIKAHQAAAVAAAFFNRQQAGLPTAHLSHAFTRPPFEDSSSAPSDNK
ncbi:uncharacterized protein LOC112558851 isoform X1 [Pomacea canaliculata]|uniref:uncharacterized protein LOC112558851 isoform X1 n=1 Tax=Pomacea canaliculata TaxID=400727 RepID=UPI000D728448|nr:uncharacterized protein LOC112558851 isoform X1 [Pomacea canaliculata]